MKVSPLAAQLVIKHNNRHLRCNGGVLTFRLNEPESVQWHAHPVAGECSMPVKLGLRDYAEVQHFLNALQFEHIQ